VSGYLDLAALAGEHYDDAWQAMAESYAEAVSLLGAVVIRKGPLVIAEREWLRARDFVTTIDPVRGATPAWRLTAIRREEAPLADPHAVDRLRAKWEQTYVRRTDP
jgi:hypothetical protein